MRSCSDGSAGPRLLLAALVLCCTLLIAFGANAHGEFRRGVNLSHWFEQEGRTPVSDREMAVVYDAGFDHVRIPIEPERLGWDPRRRASDLRIAALRRAIEQALGTGLDVILDISPSESTKQEIEDNPAVFESYASLLQALATALNQYPGDRVALELLNEPQFYGRRGGGRWQDLQARLIADVRERASELTLIAMGRKGGSLEGLAELNPYPDPKIIYSFHYYLPYIFTHQGAQWLDVNDGTTAGMFKNVLYPSELARASPPGVSSISAAEPRAREEFRTYVERRWDGKAIADQLQQVRGIVRDGKLRVICDEFGVIRDGVDEQSRDRWLHDVRKALEESSTGWTIWDYADAFGIASIKDSTGQRELDPATMKALGLTGTHR
jgi:endoglucanase